MLSHQVRLVAIAAAAAVLSAAYASRGIVLASALFALLCAGVVGAHCIRAARGRRVVLHDPAVSTLVFPPESKFQHSAFPRR
jgi:hypothetical protein